MDAYGFCGSGGDESCSNKTFVGEVDRRDKSSNRFCGLSGEAND
jgi:hypothetical protein